jgi:hypothetical protein
MITAICENTNTIISLNMDIFLLQTARNAKSDTKSGGRGVVLVMPMPGKKVLKRCSGLRPSEKQLQERRSGAKIPMGPNI